MQLENEKVITIDKENIVINSNYDTSKLKQSQQYILDNIQDGKLKSINEIVLKEKIKKDALQDGLIEERSDLKKRQIKKIIISIIIFVIAVIIDDFIFTNWNGGIEIILIAIAFSVILFFYPIIAFISLIVTSIKYEMDPYFRTEKGNELNREIEGLKKFLADYTLLSERDRNEIIIWEEYLVYSVLFNQNKKIIEEYKKYLK